MHLSKISLALRQWGAGGFSPLSLFASGEQGAWYDPSDLSTMFQDSAGTTPVTTDGQSVGKILDKSGHGNHASQATAAARPLYKTDGTYRWLQFDGVDDCLSTSAIDLTSTNKMSVYYGARKVAEDGPGIVFETSINSNTNAGSFAAIVPSSAGGNDVLARSNGSVAASVTATSIFAPVTFVATQLLDIAAPLVSLTINNGSAAVISTSQGSGNYGNHSLYLGARAGASLYFKGNVYPIIIRGAASSAAEISDAKTWVNSKTGAY